MLNSCLMHWLVRIGGLVGAGARVNLQHPIPNLQSLSAF